MKKIIILSVLILGFTFIVNAQNGNFVKTSACMACRGTGRCSMCGGRGQIWGVTGMTYCPGCWGTGRCGMCSGTGLVTMSGNYNTGVVNANGQMMVVGNGNSNSSTNNSNTNSNKKTGSWVTKPCSACKGTGKSPVKKYAPYMGGTKKQEYCVVCGGISDSHYHESCGVCKGSGKVKEYKY